MHRQADETERTLLSSDSAFAEELVRPALRFMTAATIVWFCTLFPSTPAHAHAVVVKAEPSPKSELVMSPAVVRVWFSEAVEPERTRLELLDAKGATVRADRVNTPADRKIVMIRPATLGAGTYTVQYRVVSGDGHVVEGRYGFSIRPSVGVAR